MDVSTRRLVATALVLMPFVGEGVPLSTMAPPESKVPWVEELAPGGFDRMHRAGLEESSVTYRVDATVYLPLFFTSVPVVSRSGVGIASATARDSNETRDARLREYEFFASSFPERARGLNRLGFLREAVRLTETGADWTAHFGAVSAKREETREAAEQALDDEGNQDLQPYLIIDGLIGPEQARNSVMTLMLPGRWSSALELYEDVRPRWLGREPDYTRELPNEGDRAYGQPLGFLGSLQVSLRSVAAAIARGDNPHDTHQYYVYVHNGSLFRVELRDVDDDKGRAERFVEAGWVTDPTGVRRLKYTIRDERDEEVETFELWIELPRAGGDDPFSAPLIPLAFEFKPRAFLKLKAAGAIRNERLAA